MSTPHPFATLIRHDDVAAAIHQAAHDLIPSFAPVYASLDGRTYRLTRNGSAVVEIVAVERVDIVNLDEPPAEPVRRAVDFRGHDGKYVATVPDATESEWPEADGRNSYEFPGVGNVVNSYDNSGWFAFPSGSGVALETPGGGSIRFPTRELAREALFAAHRAKVANQEVPL